MTDILVKTEVEKFYSLSKIFSILEDNGVSNTFQPYINSYVSGKITRQNQKVKKKKFMAQGEVIAEFSTENGTKNLRIQCITKKDLEYIIKEIIGEDLSPRIEKFDNALYKEDLREGSKSPWRKRYKSEELEKEIYE